MVSINPTECRYKSSCFHYLLYDLIAGTGEFDLSAYPPQIKEHSVLDNIRKSIELSLGVEISKETLYRKHPKIPLFELGKVIGTQRSLDALIRNNMEPGEYTLRHVMGDWGLAGNYYEIILTDMECQKGIEVLEDLGKINKWSVKNQDDITSIYTLPDSTVIMITTNADRKHPVIYLREAN